MRPTNRHRGNIVDLKGEVNDLCYISAVQSNLTLNIVENVLRNDGRLQESNLEQFGVTWAILN